MHYQLALVCALLLAAPVGAAGEEAPRAAPLPAPNPLPREMPAEAAPSPQKTPEMQLLDDSFAAFSAAPDLGLERLMNEKKALSVNATPNRANYWPLIKKHAEETGVPTDLADAVVMIESAYDAGHKGPVDEIGLMQITPATARRLGFDGRSEELFQPETNIRLGVTHLAQSWRQAGQDVCHTLLKYRYGLGAPDMTEEGRSYCRKALVYLASIDSAIGRSIEMPGLVRPELSASQHRFDWQEHESRMKQIDRKWGGENYGIISP